jgi:hypothetical protein
MGIGIDALCSEHKIQTQGSPKDCYQNKPMPWAEAGNFVVFLYFNHPPFQTLDALVVSGPPEDG